MPVSPIRAISLDGSLIANLARAAGKLTLSDGTDGKQLFSVTLEKKVTKKATKVVFSEEKYELFIYTPDAKYTFDLATKQILEPVPADDPGDEDERVAGFRIEVIHPGCKLKPKKGDTVHIHYVGTLASNGKKFDSSRDRNSPFQIKIGDGKCIRGWEEGILQMSLGEHSKLHVREDYAYGDRAVGSDIPPKSDLIFDIEILKINEKKPLEKKEVDIFRKSLENWVSGKLEKYDSNKNFKIKRDERHTDRAGYKAWLDKEVKSSIDEALDCLKL